jgi:phosphopantetheinyl transferase
MLFRQQHTSNGALLGIWKIEESREELLQLLPENLRTEAVAHIATIRAEQRAVEWLATQILLYTLLGEEKQILKKTNGQPYLSDNSYQISISHTRKYAAILLHPTFLAGIDIEMISERVKKIAYKFISNDEYIDPTQEVVHQLLHWAAKESLFKLLGETEVDFKQHLHIDPFTPSSGGTILAKETRSGDRESFVIHYEVCNDYVITWVIG